MATTESGGGASGALPAGPGRPRSAARRRASKRSLHAWAWVAGGLGLLVPGTALAVSPKPSGGQRPLVVHEVIRRVVVPGTGVPSTGARVSPGSVTVSPPAVTTGGSPVAP